MLATTAKILGTFTVHQGVGCVCSLRPLLFVDIPVYRIVVVSCTVCDTNDYC